MIAVIVDSELANAELRSRIRLLHVLHRANGSTKRSRFRILPQTGQDALIKRRGYGNRTPVPSDVGDLYGFEFDVTTEKFFLESDNVNDHRAAAIDLQAEKAARPAAPCATYCYAAVSPTSYRVHNDNVLGWQM